VQIPHWEEEFYRYYHQVSARYPSTPVLCCFCLGALASLSQWEKGPKSTDTDL